ncbi:D-glycero-beta-D-manno-heptose-1,7-bisphosphate 7-phosphatase-like [Aplysia californica]|uniref:D-glycero-beta-D-manno-heptose-1,7-bisphosphate 7-phosphatase-like n=1 Tax=Aplysia californica TaxID=6500 RepID=A0ABM1W488_APLCA|nr:D-glycero-beta-D-manno-heptose-1,7-bisphosphate 7-phosphatase-like [Aplysia californica]
MKLIILDKDGTITTPASGEKFVQHPQDQVLLPGVYSGLEWYKSKGRYLAIASNQGGVAAGHKTLEEAYQEMAYCRYLCNRLIDATYFCPDLEGNQMHITDQIAEGSRTCIDLNQEDKDSSEENKLSLLNTSYYRKPGPGMLKHAMQYYNASQDETLMIGDRPEDFAAAEMAGVTFLSADKWREELLQLN